MFRDPSWTGRGKMASPPALPCKNVPMALLPSAAWLRAKDPQTFSLFLREIEDGGSFAAAFRAAYGASPNEEWLSFRSSLAR